MLNHCITMSYNCQLKYIAIENKKRQRGGSQPPHLVPTTTIYWGIFTQKWGHLHNRVD